MQRGYVARVCGLSAVGEDRSGENEALKANPRTEKGTITSIFRQHLAAKVRHFCSYHYQGDQFFKKSLEPHAYQRYSHTDFLTVGPDDSVTKSSFLLSGNKKL